MHEPPEEAKAAERELGQKSRSELRDRPASVSAEQPLDPSRSRWADEATSPPPEGAKQGPYNTRIIPTEGGRSNGNTACFHPEIEG
jgi:hypothetical protein